MRYDMQRLPTFLPNCTCDLSEAPHRSNTRRLPQLPRRSRIIGNPIDPQLSWSRYSQKLLQLYKHNTMAQISADAARPMQKQQARRPLSRIVPAIPHRLSRPMPTARPITPEGSHKSAVTQRKQEPKSQPQQPAVEERKVKEQQTEVVQTPSTSEHKTLENKPEAEVEAEAPEMVGSPAKSQDQELKQVAEAPGRCSFLFR